MFRTMMAAAAALAFAAPAMAQDTDLLSGNAWECRTVSLVGDPTGDLMMLFEEDGYLGLSFYMEMPIEDMNIAVEFDLSGEWSIDDYTISVSASDFEMVGAWMDGEEMSAEDSEILADSLAAEFANYGGQSDIAYISEHAMVLEEPDTSISCWR
jgi:hypothetical protein